MMEKEYLQLGIDLPIDDAYCLSVKLLDTYFSGAHALKYKDLHSDKWRG